MGLVYKTEYFVPYYQSNVSGVMLLSSLLGVLLEISGEQSMELGRSDSWILDNYGLTWIVTDYEIDVNRMPKFLETVVIETEATSYNKLFCYRDFRVLSKEGELLLNVQSNWVLMEMESRKVSRVIEDIVDPYESEKIKKIIKGHKFKVLENPNSQIYRVRFSDIDRNQHVNNSKYYDWAIDTLDFEFLKKYIPKKIYIKYSHEVRYGDEVESKYEIDGLKTYHEINDGSALIEIEWQEDKN